MASSLNMELKTFLVVLRKVSSGELAVRSAEGSAFPSTCAVPVRQARPPFSHGRGPAREACPLFPRGPGARHHEGGGVQSEGWNLSSGAGSPRLCPFICSRPADQWLSTCALRNPVPTT